MKLEPFVEPPPAERGQFPPADATPVATAASMPPECILIVDDSLTMRAVLEVSLRQAGYTCLSFADGASALHWLCQPVTETPRLLLLDIDLPGMDGYEVARHIRAHARWNSMALILLTGHDRVTDRLKGRLLGAQHALRKPFRIEQLLATIRDTLHGSSPAMS